MSFETIITITPLSKEKCYFGGEGCCRFYRDPLYDKLSKRSELYCVIFKDEIQHHTPLQSDDNNIFRCQACLDAENADVDFEPTSEHINALPEKLRKFIHDLETKCDPAGIVRENALLKDENEGLRIKINRR